MTKILVVDDEPDVEFLIRQKFAKQLKSKEFEFEFASNGVEALKVLEKHADINIILTDINMPEMDGLALLANLPELNRIYKAVIISAYGDMSNIRKAMNQGACDFVTKPIDFNDLQITILNAIDQYLALKRSVEVQYKLTDLENELNIARNIQLSIIPHQFDPFPSNNQFEILGFMDPAKEVGGDFFDFFPLDEKRLGFVIADVSGKSISAALFMAMSRAIIRSVAKHSNNPVDCLKEANKLLCTDNETCTFVTTFYGIFDTETGSIQCANAGHNPPFILRANKTVESIGRNQGLALGIMEEAHYQMEAIHLNPGDSFILYTDGVTEAMNEEKQLYTEERLIKVLTSSPKDYNLKQLLEAIEKDLTQFIGNAPQSDDITILSIKQK